MKLGVMVLVHRTSPQWDLPMKFHVDALHSFKVILGQNSSMKISKEQQLQKYYAYSFSSFALHFSSMRYHYLLMKFQVSSLNTFWVILWTKFKNENEQRAITPKVWSFELWSCTLHFSSMRYIYLWSFMLMPCIVLKLCSGQKKGQTRAD